MGRGSNQNQRYLHACTMSGLQILRLHLLVLTLRLFVKLSATSTNLTFIVAPNKSAKSDLSIYDLGSTLAS
jgi:hypothetical protein